MPSTANTPAAMPCTSFIGILWASLSPTNTAGTSAISMPSVVPDHDQPGVGIVRGHGDGGDLRLVAHLGQKEGDEGGAEHAQLEAIWVSSSSILSGISVQTAMPMKDTPSTQRSTSGLMADGDPGAQRHRPGHG